MPCTVHVFVAERNWWSGRPKKSHATAATVAIQAGSDPDADLSHLISRNRRSVLFILHFSMPGPGAHILRQHGSAGPLYGWIFPKAEKLRYSQFPQWSSSVFQTEF